ncbi:MAG: GYD domain-containing protein [Vicinamibacterales bacterium]
MAKFMAKAKYTAAGVKGVLSEGGSARVAAITKLTESMGGKVEAFYFAYGGADAYVIVDVADEANALALSLAVNASGVVTLELVPLLTAQQMDAATKKTVAYRAPGA